MVLCCLRCALKPSASATSAFSKLYQHFRRHGSPYGLQDTLSTLRPSCSPCLHGSAMDARLDTGGWLALTRQGLSPCKRCQAFLGAITLALTCCRTEAFVGCRAVAPGPCSARLGQRRWAASAGSSVLGLPVEVLRQQALGFLCACQPSDDVPDGLASHLLAIRFPRRSVHTHRGDRS